MGADSIDAPPPSADSPLPGSDKSLGGPDASPHRDEGTPATDLDLRPIQDIEPVHRAPTGEAPGDANPVATANVDVPLADSPLSSTGTSLGGPDTGPHRDERTPATDAADSPAKTKGPDAPASALPGDEDHELTNQTGPPADGSRSWQDKLKYGVVTATTALSMATVDLIPPTATVSRAVVSAAEAVGTVSDAVDQTGKLVTEISAVVHGEPNPPGIGGAEHLATEPNPEVPVDKAPDPAGPDEPDSPVSDDEKELLNEEGERDEEKAEAEKAALESRQPDRFPRAQNSPKISDQVRDRRPTPTGRGQSRGRPK